MTDTNDPLVFQIIGCAIEVHSTLGPGLFESPYRKCLAREFELNRIEFATEVALPLSYKGVRLDCGYRIDFLVGGRIVVEAKAVERLMPIHDAQVITYLKLLGLTQGLLLNFNAELMKKGIKSIVL